MCCSGVCNTLQHMCATHCNTCVAVQHMLQCPRESRVSSFVYHRRDLEISSVQHMCCTATNVLHCNTCVALQHMCCTEEISRSLLPSWKRHAWLSWTLQRMCCTATHVLHCNTCVAVSTRVTQHILSRSLVPNWKRHLQYTATHHTHNTLQHTTLTIHCNTRHSQHTATHHTHNTLQHMCVKTTLTTLNLKRQSQSPIPILWVSFQLGRRDLENKINGRDLKKRNGSPNAIIRIYRPSSYAFLYLFISFFSFFVSALGKQLGHLPALNFMAGNSPLLEGVTFGSRV